MARWSQLLALLLVLPVSSCDETGQRGAFVVELFDAKVRCDPDDNSCRDAANERAEPVEQVHGIAFVSHLASSDGNGTYLYLELARAAGTVGVLELDVPGAGMPRVSYREITRGGARETFEAHAIVGDIEVPAVQCPCDDGRFELQLTDFGPDKIEGTTDDQIRRLSRGQFSRAGHYCRSSRLSRIDHVEGVRVIHLGCPTKRPSIGGVYPSQPDYYYEDTEIGCGVEDDAYYYEEEAAGCGGDDDYDDGYDDTGCEADDDAWDNGGDSSGCEGDGSDYDDSSGCDGDSGCEDDAYAATSNRSRAGPKRRRAPLGTLPYVIVALLVTHTRRRRRGAAATD